MSRKRTLVGGGASHFVTFSTHGRRNLLITADARDIVVGELDRLTRERGVYVAGFVVMPNHVHALLWFDDDGYLPEAMKVWKGRSARELRKLYEARLPDMIEHLKKSREGRVRVSFWQTRYHDFNVFNREKVHEKIDYTHYNPVKAGLCDAAEDWRWSSWRWYCLGEEVGVKITPGL